MKTFTVMLEYKVQGKEPRRLTVTLEAYNGVAALSAAYQDAVNRSPENLEGISEAHLFEGKPAFSEEDYFTETLPEPNEDAPRRYLERNLPAERRESGEWAGDR